jgi:hypothetical protein
MRSIKHTVLFFWYFTAVLGKSGEQRKLLQAQDTELVQVLPGYPKEVEYE